MTNSRREKIEDIIQKHIYPFEKSDGTRTIGGYADASEAILTLFPQPSESDQEVAEKLALEWSSERSIEIKHISGRPSLVEMIASALTSARLAGEEVGRKKGIIEAAQLLEKHGWNDASTMVNQKESSQRYAKALRKLIEGKP